MRTFVWLLVLSFVLAESDSMSADESPEGRIAKVERESGGRLGVAALDTGSGVGIRHRANERFPMCSTFKFLAAAAVLHRVDGRKDQLNRFVSYTKADLLEYAPVTREHVGEGGMTLGELCAAALQESDNTAGNLLLRAIGGPQAFTRYARSLGDAQTRLDRLEPGLNDVRPGDERDTTTPAAMLADLRILLLGEALSPESRERVNRWMAGNRTGSEMIRAGVPPDWKVADKTGRGARGATNDIAILRRSRGAPILLAIYSVDSEAPSAVRVAAIARVARVVAESFSR